MLLVCLLSVIWFLTRDNNIVSTFQQFYHHKTPLEEVAHEYPARFYDGEFEQSFAGRTQANIRMPFGPNPQEKNIIEHKFINNADYQNKYRMNLKQMFIDNNDWRLDPVMNGPDHFYQGAHQPIDRLDQIADFNSFSNQYDFSGNTESDCLNNNGIF